MVAASLLAAFWAAFTLALVSPGPNFAVLLGTAMQKGRPAALKVALGMAIGETVWGFGAVFGVAMLAARNPWIETALRVGGGSVPAVSGRAVDPGGIAEERRGRAYRRPRRRRPLRPGEA